MEEQDCWQSIKTLEKILRTELHIRDKRMEEMGVSIMALQESYQKELLPRLHEISKALRAVETSNATLAKNLLAEITSRQMSDQMTAEQHTKLMALLTEFQKQLSCLSKQHNEDMQGAADALTKHTKNESLLTKLLVKVSTGFGIATVVLIATAIFPEKTPIWISGIIKAILTFPGN